MDQPYKWSITILEGVIELIKLESNLTTIQIAVKELQNNHVQKQGLKPSVGWQDCPKESITAWKD